MKLFKSLLVAPATLGLLAPMSATANELNLTDVSGYSSSEEILNINDFDAAQELAVTNSRVDGLEAKFNNFEAGGFSETTSASFGANFYVGAGDGLDGNEAFTFTYDFSMGLATSFTGEDSLDIAVIAGNVTSGNSLTLVDATMAGDGTGDALQIDGIAYTFPVGGFTVTLGEGVGVDALNSGACSYAAFTDVLSNCGTPSVGGTGADGIAASYDFGNGFTAAAGVAGTGGSTDGFFTDESDDTFGLELAYSADTYGLSFAYTDDESGATDSAYYSFQATYMGEGLPLLSVGYETDDNDADGLFVGATFEEVGAGSVSVGVSSQALSDGADLYQYEIAYAYPLNDGMTITPGLFVVEQADGDDVSGLIVTTSFSF